jgi:hypothetical protein
MGGTFPHGKGFSSGSAEKALREGVSVTGRGRCVVFACHGRVGEPRKRASASILFFENFPNLDRPEFHFRKRRAGLRGWR